MRAEYFRSLARYNEWANRRLYAACASLPEAEYQKSRPSFFGSIHATLNHILVGDRLWLGRINGHTPRIVSLDQILYPEFLGLKVAREAEDAQIVNTIDSLSDARLDQPLDYTTMAGEKQRAPLRFVLGHVFNHQAHHRGQVHDMLSQTAVPPPPLDLIYYLREAGVVAG